LSFGKKLERKSFDLQVTVRKVAYRWIPRPSVVVRVHGAPKEVVYSKVSGVLCGKVSGSSCNRIWS